MDDLIDGVARALCDQIAQGRSQGQLAIELGIPRRTIGFIVRGERRIGGKTLLQILLADPPWLEEILAGVPGALRGSNGRNGRVEVAESSEP